MHPTDEDVERFCEAMHEAYERAAVDEGWQTQARSRVPWEFVPAENKATMRAAARQVLPRVYSDAYENAALYLRSHAATEYAVIQQSIDSLFAQAKEVRVAATQ